LLPRSVEESRRIARRILGPLLDYDKRHDGELLTSVRVFLTNDGSWQRTAAELGIHRQTLVYRLRRAEELTGLKPTSTEGATQLWLALCGADRANLKLDDLAT
ncbi:MAG TPA: helix-turn-helix domain-containing protein, partial [Mycobacterium sp.]|nr:helix-turn-helix domain-containing protein [Mycobacterium sp.]